MEYMGGKVGRGRWREKGSEGREVILAIYSP
jgi:hypothetical protein